MKGALKKRENLYIKLTQFLKEVSTMHKAKKSHFVSATDTHKERIHFTEKQSQGPSGSN